MVFGAKNTNAIGVTVVSSEKKHSAVAGKAQEKKALRAHFSSVSGCRSSPDIVEIELSPSQVRGLQSVSLGSPQLPSATSPGSNARGHASARGRNNPSLRFGQAVLPPASQARSRNNLSPCSLQTIVDPFIQKLVNELNICSLQALDIIDSALCPDGFLYPISPDNTVTRLRPSQFFRDFTLAARSRLVAADPRQGTKANQNHRIKSGGRLTHAIIIRALAATDFCIVNLKRREAELRGSSGLESSGSAQ